MMKITDRIDKLKGIEKSYWKNDKLTVYYDETQKLDTIKIKINKAIADVGLIRSVDRIDYLSTKKGGI